MPIIAVRVNGHHGAGGGRGQPVAPEGASATGNGRHLDAETSLAWMQTLFPAAVTAVILPLVFYFAKWYWDCRRWRVFRTLIEAWADAEFGLEELTDEDWNALVALKLTDAGFEPMKIKDLIQLAVWFAKGQSSQKAFEKIRFRQKEEDHGDAISPG